MTLKEYFTFTFFIVLALFLANYRSPEEYAIEQLQIKHLELEIQYKRLELLNKKMKCNDNKINIDSIKNK